MLVKQVTAEALEKAEAERSAWLAETCAGDAALRLEVESLLVAHGQAGAFLEVPALVAGGAADAVARAARDGGMPSLAGRQFGAYRIVRELGHGGMGVVYLAERADDAFEKQVAIKVVRGGPAGAALMQRFLEERRILARLDHPNIARLHRRRHDRRRHALRRHGARRGHADRRLLRRGGSALTRRLRLFREVCAAVQYAHQHLVIHRDLKPATSWSPRTARRSCSISASPSCSIPASAGAPDPAPASAP